jgi:hypothetical protein
MKPEYSDICKNLPDIKMSTVPMSREEKLDQLLSIFDGIEEINGYTVIKFNKKVIIASNSDLAIVSRKNIMLKTIDGAVFLN